MKMAKLKIDNKWSVGYDEENNDTPRYLYRYDSYHGPFPQDNVSVAMFYALLGQQESSVESSSVFDQYVPEPEKGTEPSIDETHPRMWEVGETVTLKDGTKRLVVAMGNVNSPYESIATMEHDYEDDCVKLIHRYNRRDYGRVTGTEGNDPRDFIQKDV